jgi:tryptophan 2,3-dioxygenase
LMFKGIVHELRQIVTEGLPSLARVKRIVIYMQEACRILSRATQIIAVESFGRFREYLAPASGFQSLQFREIELLSTDLVCLQHKQSPLLKEEPSADRDFDTLFSNLYWRNPESCAAGRPPGLVGFENRYLEHLRGVAVRCQRNNLRALHKRFSASSENDIELRNALACYDEAANVTWPGIHLAVASHFLAQANLPSTGGTDWQLYLRRRIHTVRFFPELTSNHAAQ